MGLPIFGTSNFSEPRWPPEPNDRGTWGLLQTCLLSLFLCTYSAIHLNVFTRECKWWTRVLVRCKWLCIALLAPELVVFNAWSQRRQAARLARILRRRSGQEESPSSIGALWRYLWPSVSTFDQERNQYQQNQYDGHVSETRFQMLGQERCQSQHTPQNAPKLDPQEQDRTRTYDAIKSTEGSVQVRHRTSF